ncbi:MAG TPA: GNAT family N-acetyltransferase [Pirellulales bacterium]|nr:GNAT family N-acetyltransferase [Pirellulales bacterium]
MFVVSRLRSLAELRSAAERWDDLCQRCPGALPTARAEMLSMWCESFAPLSAFRALVVEGGGQLVAALPLLELRWMGLRVGLLPGNHWSSAGDFLLDPRADAAGVCQALFEALRQDAYQLLRCDAVDMQADRWRVLFSSLDACGVAHATRPRFEVNRVYIRADWDGYLSSRSANHRRQLRRCRIRAEREGAVELTCYDELSPMEVEGLLRTCFQIEAGGWKATEHGTVLQVPGAWDFYLRQARQLAAWRQLSIVLLRYCGQPIAFEYGWRSNRVYYSAKVGYDESFGRLSPGQLLRYFLIRRFHERSDVDWFDFFGPSTPATKKWATHAYTIDRLIAAPRGGLARTVVAAYRHGWPLADRIRARRAAKAET